MKLLADENTHGRIVEWLRSEGHDVIWAAESLRGQSDDEVLDAARKNDRLLLTSDTDFGNLVYQSRLKARGVVLLRIEKMPIVERIARVAFVWAVIEANSRGKFIVVTETRVRVRKLP